MSLHGNEGNTNTFECENLGSFVHHCGNEKDDCLTSLPPFIGALVREDGMSRSWDRVQTAVGMVEKALREMTLVNQLTFIPAYKEYLGLGNLRANLNLC